MMVAVPMPAPIHSVTSPVERLRRSNSSTSVPRIMAPVAPSGWPKAMAPPLGLTLAASRSNACRKRNTTEAKASLTSNRSMSEIAMPADFNTFLVTSTGPVSIKAGSEPILAHARAGFQPGLLRGFFAADQDGGGAVDNARGIAGVMDMFDEFDVGMRLDSDRIEAAQFAHLHEGRLEGCERLHRRAGTHVFVLGQDGEAVDVLDLHHRTVEATLVPGHSRALLALDRIGVDVVAGKSIFGRD